MFRLPSLEKARAFFCLFAGRGDGLQFATHLLQLLQNLLPYLRQGVAGFVLGFQAKFNAVLVRAAMLGL